MTEIQTLIPHFMCVELFMAYHFVYFNKKLFVLKTIIFIILKKNSLYKKQQFSNFEKGEHPIF
jgi:hypothetical protein